MTKKENEFNLLNGTFTSAEAKEILVRLLKDKIRFHGQKSFNHELQFGQPDPHAKERISKLSMTLGEVLNFLEQYTHENKFEIYADVKIKSLNK
jgi:hypothetical protein